MQARVGKKKKVKGPQAADKLPSVFPTSKCKLRQLRLERVKHMLLIEEEFLANQESVKPRGGDDEEKSKVDELRGSPMAVGTLEEIIDENHAIVSTPNGPEYYVNILSFVDKDALEPGSTVLMHSKTSSVVGILGDDVDPMVSVMKVDKAPLESYADVGGLQKQIQEVKEAVELPLTHPELYEDMGIKPPKGDKTWILSSYVLASVDAFCVGVRGVSRACLCLSIDLHLPCLFSLFAGNPERSIARQRKRCHFLRPPRYGQDAAGEGRRQRNLGHVSARCWLRAHSEIPR